MILLYIECTFIFLIMLNSNNIVFGYIHILNTRSMFTQMQFPIALDGIFKKFKCFFFKLIFLF